MPPKARKNVKAKGNPKGMSAPMPPGQIMTDLVKKQWKLGTHIGQGGFGYLYLGSSYNSGKKEEENYVIKVEPFMNGPLFVEIAFYQRVAKPDKVQSWVKSKKMTYVGVPKYIASGSFENSGTRYRFMVMERFGSDIEKIFQTQKKFSLQTTFMLALRVLDALEYIHAHEYVHADIKASNLLLGFGKSKAQEVYLLDYGLAYRYAPNGVHVPYKEDPRRKHDGTTIYTSVDAHKGVAPSRRGDLEILGYCMLHWINGKLPWEEKSEDKERVFKEKQQFLDGLPKSVAGIIGQSSSEIENFFKQVNQLSYDALPNYVGLKKLFADGLKRLGVRDDGKSVKFDVEINGDAVRPGKSGRTPRKTQEKSPAKAVLGAERQDDDEDAPPVKRAPRKRRASPVAASKSRTTSKAIKTTAAASIGATPQPEIMITDDELSDISFTSPRQQRARQRTAQNGNVPLRTRQLRGSPLTGGPTEGDPASSNATKRTTSTPKRQPATQPQPAKRQPMRRPRRRVAMVDFAQSP